MEVFKRNQVQEAISRVFGERSAKPSSELRTRLKRLLETDRSLGCDPESDDPGAVRFAFFSEDSRGRGVDVSFSGYEAFALCTGLRLMRHGWPQGVAVDIMRRVRPELEVQHDRILKQDPKELFNEKKLQEQAQPGAIAFDNTDPVLLTIVSGGERSRQAEDDFSVGICRGVQAVNDFARQQKAASWTIFDVVPSAHALEQELARAKPRRRGRSG